MVFKDEDRFDSDPDKEEEEEEEEEEVDLVDPLDTLKEECSENKHCQKFKDELESCNERVNSRQNTEETCTQELFDFIHSVDHCVSQTLFKHLK